MKDNKELEEAARKECLERCAKDCHPEWVELEGGIENVIMPQALNSFIEGAVFGATHEANRTVDEVVGILERHKQASFECADYETDELVKNIHYGVGIELTEIITQLTQLKKI